MNNPMPFLVTAAQLEELEEEFDLPRDLTDTQLREYLYWKGLHDERFFYAFFLREWVSDDTGALVPSPPFHAELRAAMDDNSTIAIIPRGFGKTTNGKMRYVRMICYEKFNHVLFWMSGTLLKSVLADIRTVFEDNPRMRYVFGNLVPSKAGTEKKNQWTGKGLHFTNGCRITGITQWSAVRGGRYDEIWADDVQEDHDVHNPEIADKFRHHFAASLLPSLKPGGKIHVTGTNVGHACLVKQLFDEPKNGFTKLWYEAITNIAYGENGRMTDGDMLWPARFPLETLEVFRRQMGSRIFAQEFLNTPYVSNGTPVFDMTEIEPTRIEPLVVRPSGVEYFTNEIVTDAFWGIDLAAGGADGDFSTIIGIEGSTGKIFCQWAERVPQHHVAAVMEDIWNEGHRGVVVPERNFALAFLDACRGRAFYPHALYRERAGADRFGARKSKDYGFTTTASSKRKLVSRLRDVLRKRKLVISEELFREMGQYRYDAKGGMNATLGHHDDRLMALMIAHYARWSEVRTADIDKLKQLIWG